MARGNIDIDQLQDAVRQGAGTKLATTDGSFTAGNVPKYDTDGKIIDSGTAPGGITALTGDVTASGTGSVAATLANIPNDVPMAGDLLPTAIAAPATPAAGKGRVYMDSTSKNLAVKNDAGTVNHGVQTKASASHKFLTAIADDGTVSSAQPDFSDLTGTQPYDVVCSLVGLPGAGATVLIVTFTRNVAFAGNFSGSQGTVGTNPTSTATYTVNKNGSSIGTAVVSTGGVVTFTTTSGAAQSFVAGDRMTVTAPGSQDATLADVAITLAGTR